MKQLQKNVFPGLAADSTIFVAGLVSVLYIFLNAYSFPNITFILTSLLFFALFFIISYSFIRDELAKSKKKKRTVFLAAVSVWILAGLLAREEIYYGAVISVEFLLMEGLQGYAFAPADFFAFSPASATVCTIFSIYVLIPYVLLLSWDVIFRKSRFISLLLTVPVYVSVYVLQGPPSGLPQAILFVFWITLIIRPRKLLATNRANAGITLTCFGLSALLVVSLFTIYPQETYETPSILVTTRNQILGIPKIFERYASQSLIGYSRGAPLTGSSGTVNLNQTGSLRFPNTNVMRVYSEFPYEIYLRGYSASYYTGHSWLPGDETAYSDSGIEIEPLAYMEQTGGAYFNAQPHSITVELLTGKSNYTFIPYLFTEIQTEDATLDWAGDQYLAGGSRTAYQVKSYSGIRTAISVVGYGTSFLEYREGHVSAEKTGTVDFNGYTLQYRSSRTGPIFVDIQNVPRSVIYEAYNYYNNTPGLDTVSLFYPEENRDAEYMRYITETYTQLPEGLDEELRGWWHEFRSDKANEGYGNYFNGSTETTPYWNWIYAARSVLQTIRDSGTYTTNPGAQPKNQDFVQYFLTERNEGYCTHFASATVAMLRAFGIPARYVEGYLVKSTYFGEDGWADVPADSAHAWAEIWVPDYGWIPVDATPSATTANTPAGNVGSQAEAEEIQENLPETGEETLEEDVGEDIMSQINYYEGPEEMSGSEDDIETLEKEFGKTVNHSIVRVLSRLIISFAVLAALLLLFRLTRDVYRRKLFNMEDTNKAALHIYNHLSKLSVYGKDPSDAAHQLALKARFSNHSIIEEELDLLKAEFEDCRQELRVALDRKKKIALWLQAIL